MRVGLDKSDIPLIITYHINNSDKIFEIVYIPNNIN
jgi:hypothetical protein